MLSHPLLGAENGKFHTSTEWQLKPSLKYDALCLLNTLSGDPYYLQFYRGEYDHFHPLFTPEENAAFVRLKRVIKDEHHGIVSAQLSLYYSTVEDQTLPEMISTARDSSAMQAALKNTPYYSDSAWKAYDEGRPALEIALRALDRIGFASYWDQIARPGVERRIAGLAPNLPKFNIIPEIEHHLGFALPSQTITVYVLSYSEPHGIRVSGLRFLTHKSYPFGIVLHNAIHESMHPPFDRNEPRVQNAIDLLSGDPLVVDKVKHHDPSFGYNTADGYIEEDSVEALEQIVSEHFGQGRDAHRYWKQQDGGMHVLATAIYTDYKAALQRGPQKYSEWFVRAVEDGELRESNLQATVKHFSLVTAIETTIIVAVLVSILIGSICAFLAFKTQRNAVGWFFWGFFLNVFALAAIGAMTIRKKFNGSRPKPNFAELKRR